MVEHVFSEHFKFYKVV